MAGKVIAVDIDEVLAGFLPSLINFHNDTYNSSLTMEDFFSYEFHHVWGDTYDECQIKMGKFFSSNYFIHGIKPIDGAIECLKKLKEHGFDLQIVTSRQYFLADNTRQWVSSHYPDIFSNIEFGNHYAASGKQRSKLEICRSINACVLIDDSAKYASQCAAESFPVILYGNYAWNSAEQLGLHFKAVMNSTMSSSEDVHAIAQNIESMERMEERNQEIAIKEHEKIKRAHNWEDVANIILNSDFIL